MRIASYQISNNNPNLINVIDVDGVRILPCYNTDT